MANERRTTARCLAPLVLAALVLALPLGPRAHEIPNDVTVHAFLRPEGQRLRLLVRAPIAAMRDVLFPTRDETNLDLARAEPAVRDAATLWISDSIAIYEGGTRLGAPADHRDADLAALRSVVCLLRRGARARHRTAAGARHRDRLEPGAARRPVRVSDPVGPVRLLDRPGAGAARHPQW